MSGRGTAADSRGTSRGVPRAATAHTRTGARATGASGLAQGSSAARAGAVLLWDLRVAVALPGAGA
jgi:hypothetical protein